MKRAGESFYLLRKHISAYKQKGHRNMGHLMRTQTEVRNTLLEIGGKVILATTLQRTWLN